MALWIASGIRWKTWCPGQKLPGQEPFLCSLLSFHRFFSIKRYELALYDTGLFVNLFKPNKTLFIVFLTFLYLVLFHFFFGIFSFFSHSNFFRQPLNWNWNHQLSSECFTKRYMARNSEYRNALSHASQQTLIFQGGIMDEEQAARFEQDPKLSVIARLHFCSLSIR